MPKLDPDTMLPVFLVVVGITIWWFIFSYKITIEEKPLKKNFSGTQMDVPIMVFIPGSYGPTKISDNLFSFRINFDKVDFPHKKVSPNQRNSLRILISVKNDKKS